jgi:hypothetical protein
MLAMKDATSNPIERGRGAFIRNVTIPGANEARVLAQTIHSRPSFDRRHWPKPEAVDCSATISALKASAVGVHAGGGA